MIESANPAGGFAVCNHLGCVGVVTETPDAGGNVLLMLLMLLMSVTGAGSGGASSNERHAASGGVRGA